MPEDQIQPAFHEHPMNMHERVYGVRLAAGAVLNADTDVYGLVERPLGTVSLP